MICKSSDFVTVNVTAQLNIPAFSAHLPKVRGFPVFSAHLPKVCNRPGSSVAPVPAFSFPAAFSHLPKVSDFPTFSAHLLKVRSRPGSSVAPVPAFSFPAAFSHLPKVSDFPAFSAHLPKVRNRSGALCSACARVFVSSCLFPPSGGTHRNGMPDHRCRITGCMYDFYTIFKKLDTCRMNFIQLNVFENYLNSYDTVIYLKRHNFCNE